MCYLFFYMIQYSKVGDYMNNTLDHKCPSCNAVLKFNPHSQNWICEYCRNTFNLEQLITYENKSEKILEEKENKQTSDDVNMYLCKNCGAQIIADSNTSATSCVYCKNTAILKDKLQGKFNPDYVIPFKNTKEDAINAFKKLGKGKILMPKAFNDKKNISEMSGIYVPFWLYDYEANGIVEADCKIVSSWRSGNYRYTKTDTYLATRSGNMNFERVPVDGSKRFENDVMNSIEPFDYKDLKEFNYSYLSGFLSEKFDVEKEEALKEANIRAKNSFVDEMMKDIKGYTTVIPTKNSVNLYNSKSCYVLLPVWMLNIKYNNKIYTFAMNGQTGKLIGNIPIDKTKAIFMWILIFAITFILVFIISYLVVKS